MLQEIRALLMAVELSVISVAVVEEEETAVRVEAVAVTMKGSPCYELHFLPIMLTFQDVIIVTLLSSSCSNIQYTIKYD
jgi:hypothetical protein